METRFPLFPQLRSPRMKNSSPPHPFFTSPTTLKNGQFPITKSINTMSYWQSCVPKNRVTYNFKKLK